MNIMSLFETAHEGNIMSKNKSGSPNIGAKVMRTITPIIEATECGVAPAVALRHFCMNKKTITHLQNYCLNESPNYSVKTDMDKTKNFHSVKQTKAVQDQIAQGAGFYSATQMENARNELRKHGINLDDMF